MSTLYNIFVSFSYPSLGWQLLVHLYHAKEGVILLVDQPHPLTMAALGTLHPCKVTHPNL